MLLELLHLLKRGYANAETDILNLELIIEEGIT